MHRNILVIPSLLLAAITIHAAGPKPDGSMDAKAAFARLKSLAGEWEADTKAGRAKLTYELIAGGTSIVEREAAEKRPSMYTVYHLDGGRLLLTHYCMAGNQPRMVARSFNAETGELKFDFLDATNLKEGGGHMHAVTMKFKDNDHLLSEWVFYENGQQKFAEAFEYTRVR